MKRLSTFPALLLLLPLLFISKPSFAEESTWDTFEFAVRQRMDAAGKYGAGLMEDIMGADKSPGDGQRKKSRESRDVSANRGQDFTAAKKHLRRIHADMKWNRTVYCDAAFDGKGQISLPKGFVLPTGTQAGIADRATRLEWEHMVPAENFGRHFRAWRDGDPACNGKKGRECARKSSALFREFEGDMHNLFPSIGAVNALRSNYSYAQFESDTPPSFGACAMKIYDRRAEPPDAAKGIAARASLYMQDRGEKEGMKIFSDQKIRLFEVWDKAYLPEKAECERNRRIAKIQGWDNPYVTRRCGE